MRSGSQPAVLGRDEPRVVGEPRWPMAGAVIAVIVLTFLLPADVRLGPSWLVPCVEGVLLGAVVMGDPGRIDRRSRVLRGLSIALVAVLAFTTLWVTAQLVDDLINGGPETNSARELLRAGAVVWVSNNIAFALFYWELDSGGSAARAHHLRQRGGFAFPQQMNPELGWGDWRPQFIDYLYLGFTNATAFSPTDVMPLTLKAKYTMLVQSTVALALFGLIVARAVNAFT